MPERVGDQAQRDTTVPGTAAWGDPPITMRCGVERPAVYTPTSKLLDVNGIGWLSEQTDDGSRFTSVATSPMIEVSVPFAQEPASGPLTEIAAALTALAQTSSAS